MKFCKQLRMITDQSPWSDNYINYKRLKKIISHLHLLGSEQPERSYDQIWVTFMKEFLKELRQSDNLIAEKIRTFQSDVDAITNANAELARLKNKNGAEGDETKGEPSVIGSASVKIATPTQGETSDVLSKFELPDMHGATAPLASFWGKEMDEMESAAATEDTSTDEYDHELGDAGRSELGDADRSPTHKRRRIESRPASSSSYMAVGAQQTNAYFRLQNLQVEVCQVQKFLHVNFTAVTKITKKFDKVFNTKYQAKVLVPCKNRKVEQLTRLNKIEGQVQALLERVGKEPIESLDQKEILEKAQHVKFLQEQVGMVMSLDLGSLPCSSINNLQLVLSHDGLTPTCIPVIVAKGKFKGPTLGLASNLAGDELGGIPVINQLLRQISLDEMNGIVIGLPVLNPGGFVARRRHFLDGHDLDSKFPGRPDGDAAEVFCHGLLQKVVKKLNFLIELKSGSLRTHSCFFSRTDITDENSKKVAFLLNPQAVVHENANPATLRGAALAMGVPAVTFNIAGPESQSVDWAAEGVENVLSFLKIQNATVHIPAKVPVLCSESKCIHSHVGGVMRIRPSLGEWLKKGDLVATVHDVFGSLLCQFVAPEDGIVITRNMDSVCSPGDALIKYGIVAPSSDKPAT